MVQRIGEGLGLMALICIGISLTFLYPPWVCLSYAIVMLGFLLWYYRIYKKRATT